MSEEEVRPRMYVPGEVSPQMSLEQQLAIFGCNSLEEFSEKLRQAFKTLPLLGLTAADLERTEARKKA